MNIKDFKFPIVTSVDAAFPTYGAIPELLNEAKSRGFYSGRTPYNKLFSTLFYNGGKVEFKKDVDHEYVLRAWSYCRCLMSSWTPKHEDKEAICALIMSEVLEPSVQSEQK